MSHTDKTDPWKLRQSRDGLPYYGKDWKYAGRPEVMVRFANLQKRSERHHVRQQLHAGHHDILPYRPRHSAEWLF